MIRFYELQREYYSRSGLLQSFGLAIGYYVSAYYVLLWGMLDQLTLIAKYAKELTLEERDCGIRSKTFWKEFREQEPELTEFITSSKISRWIDVMADIRHHAAHKVIKIPTSLVSDTDESEKSDKEILEIVKKEKTVLYEFMPEDYMKAMEPEMISHWRISKMKVVAPSIIYIRDSRGRSYLWDPVISVDHDLHTLTAVMDAFLVRLFKDL
jgi:hypothetical protein